MRHNVGHGVTVDDQEMAEARAWAADCEGRSGLMPVHVTVAYVAKHYPGGWPAFVAELADMLVTV